MFIGETETVWHVVSSALVLLLSLFVSLRSTHWFGLTTLQAVFCLVWHTLFSIIYYVWTLNNASDSLGYFINSLSEVREFNLGTIGVNYFVSIFSSYLNMSFFGTSLVFNLLGFVGLVAFAGAVKQVSLSKNLFTLKLAVWLPLLPGMNFWTGMVGKDAISFMATGLAAWAILRMDRRYPAFVLALVAMLLVRPHMAGIMLLALAMAAALAMKASIIVRLGISMVLIPLAGVASYYILGFLGLENVGALSEVADYIETRQGYNMEGGGGVDIANMNFFNKLFTYAYRPLFLDAPGAMGMFASLENVVVITLTAIAIFRFRISNPVLPAFASLYILIYSFAAWAILASTTANLGIAARQKWMFVPLLLLFCVTLLPRNRLQASVKPSFNPYYSR